MTFETDAVKGCNVPTGTIAVVGNIETTTLGGGGGGGVLPPPQPKKVSTANRPIHKESRARSIAVTPSNVPEASILLIIRIDIL
jgi:phage tail tape-measure protein